MLKLKNKYFAIIYEGIIYKRGIRKIHKDLYDATINSKVVDPVLLNYVAKLTRSAIKINQKQSDSLIAVAVLDFFNKNEVNNKAKHIIIKDLTDEVEDKKGIVVKDFIKDSRSNGRIFYLASSHNDCAEDHKPYQGKIYVDKDWKKIIGDNKEVAKYINSHKTMIMQASMEAPGWFITRPNCRHYFVSVGTEEILYNSRKKLMNKYDTHSKEGDRDFQTPKTRAIEQYSDRLAMLRMMYNKFPTEKLKRMIQKTELLIKKWKNTI